MCAGSPWRSSTSQFQVSYLKEWDHQIENQPNIHHLDVRCLGKVFGDGDEHGRQDEQYRQVDCDDSLKEEGLEVVGHVGDDDQQQRWDVNSKDGAQQSPNEGLSIIFEENRSAAE